MKSFFNQKEMFKNKNQVHNLILNINNITIVTFDPLTASVPII